MNRSELLTKIDQPRELEKLYQDNKTAFKTEFNLLYPELTDNKLADYWNERLNYESSEISWGSRSELIFVIFASLLAGIIAKLPELLSINSESFYQRNIGFIVFPILTAYFIWKNSLSTRKIVLAGVAFLIALMLRCINPSGFHASFPVLSFTSSGALINNRTHLMPMLHNSLTSSIVPSKDRR